MYWTTTSTSLPSNASLTVRAYRPAVPVSDPLAVPRTAHAMLEGGIDPAVVEQVTWRNAITAYAQSGQIDVEELEQAATIDQTQLFLDNSVLRGQEPRVDESISN